MGIGLVGQAHAFKQLLGFLGRFGLGLAEHMDGSFDDVLEHGHVREQVELLEDHADARGHLTRALLRQLDPLAVALFEGQRFAIDEDIAAGELLEGHHQAQDRRLARTAGSDEGDAFARCDREVEVLEHGCGSEALLHVLELDRRRGRGGGR